MRIRMLKNYRALKQGQVLDQDDGVAEMYIAKRWAERLPADAQVERMVPAAPVEVTISRHPRRSGKTRSRKRATA